MSWLSDIAGRAEDLLNRVDKSAAGALQRTKNSSSHFEELTKVIPLVEQEVPPKQPVAISSFSTNPRPRKANSGTVSPSHVNRPKVDKDEKLFEFLNSPETAKLNKKFPQLVKKENIEEMLPEAVEEKKCDVTAEEKSLPLQQNSNSCDQPTVQTEAAEVVFLEKTEISDKLEDLVPQHENEKDIVPETRVNTDADSAELVLQLEMEKRQLQNEAIILNQELQNYRKRCEESDGEIRRLQKKSEHWNSQVSTSDHLIRELQEKESDLKKALDAKDSQLAVLRVRFQETDQELMVQRTLVETLRNENEKILKDINDSGNLHLKTLESLQEKNQETELALRHEQEARKLAEVESLHRFSKLEEEQKSLTESLTSLQKKYMDEKNLFREQALQQKTLQAALDLTKQELVEYRQKAQRNLQSKKKLIATLKETREDNTEEVRTVVESVESEDLKQERDSLKDELQRANASLTVLRSDFQATEQSNQQEVEELLFQTSNLEKQLQQALQRNEELQLDHNQLNEELRYTREDLTKTKTNLQIRIKDRDAELEKLRKQLTTKQLTSSSQSELESRIRALTENLIQKQTLVEALSTEKNSLVVQLERMEQKMKVSSQVSNSRSPVHVGITFSDDDSKNRLPMIMTESPYDNAVTQRVKRAYSMVDSFSVRLGVFLRHYPVARVFVIFYMVLLHLWVMIVLLTYQPEVHGSQKLENKTGPK